MSDKDKETAMEEGQEIADSKGPIISQMLADPNLRAALQGKIGSMVGHSSGYIESLPSSVKRRLKALKKLQLETTHIEAKFYEEIHALEMKYHKLYNPLYEKRNTITKGSYEPTEEECDWSSDEEKDDDEDAEGLSKDIEDKVKLKNENGEDKEAEMDENVAGVPEFWLTIFKNVDMIQDMVQDHDEPILKHLTDIKLTFTENPMGFDLHFHFDSNEYFSNTVLTKHYDMKCEVADDDPFSFEGPEIVKSKGCKIEWKQGKNITEKTVKKTQKHKSKGNVRTVSKTMKQDSFFNFFDPPIVPEDEDDLDPETQELLQSDFEIGHYIRERIIPRAVLFFTGEALDEEDDDYEDEDEEIDEEEDEENDPDYDPSKDPKKNQDCKQQ